MKAVVVLDSSALLAFLYGEAGRGKVEQLLMQAADERVDVRLHRLHLGEVYYTFHRKAGESSAEAMVEDVQHLPIRLEDRISPVLMREAARLKTSYRISYADAYAVGLARVRRATLVSCDRRELGPLEAAGVASIRWIR